MDSVPVARNGQKFLMPKSTSRKGIRVVGKIMPNKESEGHCSCSQVSVSREGDYASLILHDQANGYRDTYKLDGCYEQEESANKLFVHEVKPLLQGILNGDNSCVIAYGAKGSGKTQLIQGSVEIPGLAMMAVCEIFSIIGEAGGSMAISCYEIYHDHIYDLLEHKEQEVQILEDAEKKIQLRGLSKVPIESLSDFEKYYFPISNQQKLPQKATKEFKVLIESQSKFEKYHFPISNQRKLPQKATKEFKVRSHKGLIIYVTCIDKESKNSLDGKINFVDLEGYEDVRKQTDAKAYLSDCTKINKSLYALLNVVSALNGDETYIPYREAKLTRLLQDFLCMKNAVLVTCLSTRLFPDAIQAISLASRSCQIVNRLKHDSARNSKECRGPFPSLSSIYGIHPSSDKTVMKRGTNELGSSRKKINGSPSKSNRRFQAPDSTKNSKECRGPFPSLSSIYRIRPSSDKTVMKRGTNELGSSRKKINGSPSKSNRRFQAPGSAIKKPAASPFWSKGKKLFNVASPLAKAQRLANTWSEEECVGSNSFAASSALREENVVSSAISVSKQCPLEEDASVPDSHIPQSFDISLETDLELSLDPEGFDLKSGQCNSCDDGGKHSPTLTEQLRHISNTLKALSSQHISICTSKADGPCNSQLSIECVEPKTPGFPSCTKLDCYSIPESFTTPQEKLKTRSAGLKKSLVNECLDFLNSAGMEELKQLKGIGEKRANYILELREETPKPFKEIGDLKGLGLSSKQIKGMMSKILAEL